MCKVQSGFSMLLAANSSRGQGNGGPALGLDTIPVLWRPSQGVAKRQDVQNQGTRGPRKAGAERGGPGKMRAPTLEGLDAQNCMGPVRFLRTVC